VLCSTRAEITLINAFILANQTSTRTKHLRHSHTTQMKRHFGIISASLLVVSRSLNSLFKVLFNFRSHYLFAIGLAVIFSLRRCIPPTSSCTLKQPYSQANAFVLASTGPTMFIRDFNPLWSTIRSFVWTNASRNFKLKQSAHTQHRPTEKISVRPLRWALPCSFAITRGITFVFSSSGYWYV